MQNLVDTLRTWWCTQMHGNAMWPAHGYYQCGTCRRLYPVAWANHTNWQRAGSGQPALRPQNSVFVRG